jgi:ubiquitin carboxyl-terminal hydrolase 25/28
MFEHLANQVDLVETLSSELAEDTIAEAKDCEEEIDSLRATIAASRASIEEVWNAHQDVVYQLSAVFIHRGTASSGHYFIYQRDSKRPDRWLKCVSLPPVSSLPH